MSDIQNYNTILDKSEDSQINAEKEDIISDKKHRILVNTKEKVREVIETVKDSIKEMLPHKNTQPEDHTAPEFTSPFHCNLRAEFFE